MTQTGQIDPGQQKGQHKEINELGAKYVRISQLGRDAISSLYLSFRFNWGVLVTLIIIPVSIAFFITSESAGPFRHPWISFTCSGNSTDSPNPVTLDLLNEEKFRFRFNFSHCARQWSQQPWDRPKLEIMVPEDVKRVHLIRIDTSKIPIPGYGPVWSRVVVPTPAAESVRLRSFDVRPMGDGVGRSLVFTSQQIDDMRKEVGQGFDSLNKPLFLEFETSAPAQRSTYRLRTATFHLSILDGREESGCNFDDTRCGQPFILSVSMPSSYRIERGNPEPASVFVDYNNIVYRFPQSRMQYFIYENMRAGLPKDPILLFLGALVGCGVTILFERLQVKRNEKRHVSH